MSAGRLVAGLRGGMMVQSDAAISTRGGVGVGVWIFRVLVVAGAGLMLYSWFQPWWSTDIAVIKGEMDMVLHPWGVEAASQVRVNIDQSAFQMPFPQVFAGFMWVYLVVCMLLLAASLILTRRVRLGPIAMPLAMVLILLVGLSYMVAAGAALGIGTLKAGAYGINFLGKGFYTDPTSEAKLKMVSDLQIGYWLSLGAGGALFVLGLIRPLFVRTPKA